MGRRKQNEPPEDWQLVIWVGSNPPGSAAHNAPLGGGVRHIDHCMCVCISRLSHKSFSMKRNDGNFDAYE